MDATHDPGLSLALKRLEGLMQTPEEDFPYTSDDPSLAPIENADVNSVMTAQQVDELKASLRLALGSYLNGRDVYAERLRRIQATQASVKPEEIVIDEDETAWEQLRYFLLGVLFETPDVIQRGLGTAERVASRVYNLISKITSPVTDSRVFNPVRSRVDKAAARGEKVIDQLIMKGRIEEQNSRLMLQQQNIDMLINDFVEYLVVKTEIRQIIQEQGVGMAGDVVDDFREQSAAVDTNLEQRLRGLFRRRPTAQAEAAPGELPEGGKE